MSGHEATRNHSSGWAPRERDAVCLSIVIPVFNEESWLESVLSEVHRELTSLEPLSYEVWIIDDGSTDGTWSRIELMSRERLWLHGLRLSRNFGKEAALAAGLEHAAGEAVIVMDGDLQHPPALIGDMVSIWRRGDADIVEAVKNDRGKEPFWHRLRAALFYKLLSGIPGTGLNGATDFKLLDRKVIEAWRRMGERNIFFRGMAAWLGFRRREIAFSVPRRAGGRSRWPLLQLIRLAVTGITSFSSLPLQITTVIGVLFLLFSLLLGGQTLYMKFSGQAFSGFTTVILLLLILGSCILISIGILGIYIARIYEEVKGRPRYLVLAHTRTGGEPPENEGP